jgi:hypothetical protein
MHRTDGNLGMLLEPNALRSEAGSILFSFKEEKAQPFFQRVYSRAKRGLWDTKLLGCPSKMLFFRDSYEGY